MRISNMKVANFGQIKDADVSFGDLTIFTGAQATGKSIFLQLFKLMMDTGSVQEIMSMHGIDYQGKLPEFLDVYFGSGMHKLWKGGSNISKNGEEWDFPEKVGHKKRGKKQSVFYVPAQRVLTLGQGWPRHFYSYSPGDPFVVRQFSDQFRMFVEEWGKQTDTLFPQKGVLTEEFRNLIEKDLFSGYELVIDKSHIQKRLMLRKTGTRNSTKSLLPFMVWSAGQREAMPLLLSFHHLLPRGKTSMRDSIRWVILEEPESGLHPRAINVFLLLTLALLYRGYRVCLSTHSPQVLEMVWALRHIQEKKSSEANFLKAFGIHEFGAGLKQIAQETMKKKIKTYYFCRDAAGKVKAQDISALDLDDSSTGGSLWGGLLEFSDYANRAVSDAVMDQ